MGSTSHTILRLGCSIPAARNGGRWRGVEEGGVGGERRRKGLERGMPSDASVLVVDRSEEVEPM